MAPFLLHIYLLSIFFSGFQVTEDKDLKLFAARFFSKDPSEINLKKHSSPGDLAESGLGDPIFMVFDKNDSPLGVIKTISIDGPSGKKLFQAEFQALDTLSHLPLKTFHVITPKGMGEITLDGKKSGLIAEEYAKGKSINGYLKAMDQSRGDAERAKLFSELRRAVEKTAIALAELHLYKSFPYPAQNYLLKFDSDDLPGPFGLIHGDTHPGNIFYDAKTDTLSLIDFGSAHVERNGAPVLQDAGNFLLTLEIFASYYHLSAEEIDILKNTFTTIYTLKVPGATDGALEFYKNYYVKSFASPSSWDKGQSNQAQFIHSYCNEMV